MAFKYILVCVLLVATQTLSQAPADPAAGPPAAADSAESSKETPDPPPTPKPTLPKSKCWKTGIMCSDCETKAMCINKNDPTSPDPFMQIEQKCADGSHCINGECVEGAPCNEKSFSCMDQGFFPDPYDCTQYHYCFHGDSKDKLDTLAMKCGPGRGGYDADTGTCGLPMNSTACTEGQVTPCTEEMQVSTISPSKQIFAICTFSDDGKELGPDMYRCPLASKFDLKTLTCVPDKKKK